MPATKILVIDDDPDIQAILRVALEREGYQVAAAMDAMQGPMSARKENPQLIILDIMMPAGGGAAVFQRLKQNSFTMNIPVLIYSAVSPEQIRQALPLAGSTTVLTKPQEMDNLLAEVKKLLPSS